MRLTRHLIKKIIVDANRIRYRWSISQVDVLLLYTMQTSFDYFLPLTYNNFKIEKWESRIMENKREDTKPFSKANENRKKWIGMGCMLLAGAIAGFAMGMISAKSGVQEEMGMQYMVSLVVDILAICVGIYAQLIIHEAGHLVFGLLSGYRFSSFRIGNMMWLKEDGKLVFRKLTIAGTGGQCLMVPPEMKQDKIPVFLYNLGGCIMNVIVSVLVFIVYILIPKGNIGSALLLAVAAGGMLIAVTNGVPLTVGMIDNDGKNAVSLGKNHAAMKAFWIQLKVNEQLTKGIRLKDMPDDWFVFPEQHEMKNSMVATQAVFVCNRLLDQNQFQEADRLMKRLLETQNGVVGLHRSLLVCDRMYCEMIGENRSEILANMFTQEQKKFMKSMKRFPSVIRTEYTYAVLAEKNMEKAKQLQILFDKTAKTYPYPSDVQSERELMQRVDFIQCNRYNEH